ncbi:hypothetical protein, partial [Lactiplantibacillus pentosus]
RTICPFVVHKNSVDGYYLSTLNIIDPLMDAHKIDLKKLNKDKQKAFDIFGKYGSFAALYREGTEADIHFVDNYISLAAVYEQRKLVGLE